MTSSDTLIITGFPTMKNVQYSLTLELNFWTIRGSSGLIVIITIQQVYSIQNPKQSGFLCTCRLFWLGACK